MAQGSEKKQQGLTIPAELQRRMPHETTTVLVELRGEALLMAVDGGQTLSEGALPGQSWRDLPILLGPYPRRRDRGRTSRVAAEEPDAAPQLL